MEDETPVFPYDIDHIQSRAELLVFMRALLISYRAAKEDWENPDLDTFLEAMTAWIEDHYDCRGEPSPPANWRAFAEMLRAGAMYE